MGFRAAFMNGITLERWCSRIIEGGWLLIALGVPLAFDAGSAQPFEPAKVAVLRTIVVFMVVAWLVEAGGQRSRGPETCPEPSRGEQGGRNARRVSFILHPSSVCTRQGVILLLALTLALIYLAAATFSIAPRISLWGSYSWRQGAYTFLCLLALFALVAGRLRTRPQRERLVTAMLCASAVVSGYGLIQFAGLDPIPWERAGERAFATLGHPNFLGLYLAMTMPLAAARLLATPRWPRRSLYAGLLFAQAGCLLATVSRSAWLGALVASVVLSLLARQGPPDVAASRARRARWTVVGLGTLAMALAALAAWAYADPGGWASGGLLEPVHSLLRGKSATTTIRLLTWPAAAQIVAARPILGTGPESFELAFQAVYPPALTAYGGAGATGGQVHNEFLDWAVNVGLPGLAAYLALVLAVCWRGWRAVQHAPRDEALLAAALIASVAAYLVANQFSFGTAATRSALWLSLGMLAACGGTLRVAQTRRVSKRWGQGLAGATLLLAALIFVLGTNVVPLLADAHARAGMRHLTAGDWPAAIAAYEQAIALQPEQDRYHALLASARVAQAVNGEVSAFPLAEAAIARAIALSPRDEAHWLMLGDVRRYWGEATPGAAHLDRAIAAYREAQRLSPTDPEPLVKMAQVYMLQGRPAEAVSACQAALALDPLNVAAYTHLALACEALGRPADAAEARRQATRAAEEIDRLVSKR